MTDKNCGNCMFASGSDNPPNIICHRNPPSAIVVSASQDGIRTGVQTMGVFPPLMPTEWCGEWRPRGPASVTVLQGGTTAHIVSAPTNPNGGDDEGQK